MYVGALAEGGGLSVWAHAARGNAQVEGSGILKPQHKRASLLKCNGSADPEMCGIRNAGHLCHQILRRIQWAF